MEIVGFEVVCLGKTFVIRVSFKDCRLDFPILGRIDGRVNLVRFIRKNTILAWYNIIGIHSRPVNMLMECDGVTPQEFFNHWQATLSYFTTLQRQAVNLGVSKISSDVIKQRILGTAASLESFRQQL